MRAGGFDGNFRDIDKNWAIPQVRINEQGELELVRDPATRKIKYIESGVNADGSKTYYTDVCVKGTLTQPTVRFVTALWGGKNLEEKWFVTPRPLKENKKLEENKWETCVSERLALQDTGWTVSNNYIAHNGTEITDWDEPDYDGENKDKERLLEIFLLARVHNWSEPVHQLSGSVGERLADALDSDVASIDEKATQYKVAIREEYQNYYQTANKDGLTVEIVLNCLVPVNLPEEVVIHGLEMLGYKDPELADTLFSYWNLRQALYLANDPTFAPEITGEARNQRIQARMAAAAEYYAKGIRSASEVGWVSAPTEAWRQDIANFLYNDLVSGVPGFKEKHPAKIQPQVIRVSPIVIRLTDTTTPTTSRQPTETDEERVKREKAEAEAAEKRKAEEAAAKEKANAEAKKLAEDAAKAQADARKAKEKAERVAEEKAKRDAERTRQLEEEQRKADEAAKRAAEEKARKEKLPPVEEKKSGSKRKFKNPWQK